MLDTEEEEEGTLYVKADFKRKLKLNKQKLSCVCNSIGSLQSQIHGEDNPQKATVKQREKRKEKKIENGCDASKFAPQWI